MDLFSLEGKTAVVIGAGSGIGEAVALGCERQGARVVRLDIKADETRRIDELDIRDSASVDRVFTELDAAHGGVDIVICTPSINVRKPILKYTDEELSRVLDVNIKGNFTVLRAAGRVMTARKKGSIVLFASVRAQVVEPGQSAYAATKAGIVQLARTAAAEFGPHGVRVNAIAPGWIETALTAPLVADAERKAAITARTPLGRWGHPADIAGAALFLASPAAAFITGTVLPVDGGYSIA